MGISSESIQILQNIALKYSRNLLVIRFDEIAYDLRLCKTGRHTPSVYAKIFFSRLPKEINRILYLDSDTIVVDNLHEFYNMDLRGNVVAGVETLHNERDSSKMLLRENEPIINDGVLLIDLLKWKENHFMEKCLNYINECEGMPPVLSEGTINYICRGMISIINPRYNLMSGIVGQAHKKLEIITGRKYYTEGELELANNNPAIIHYLSGFFNRPWCSKCTHPLKDYYYRYKKMTIFSDSPLLNKKLSIRIKIIGILYKFLPANIFVLVRNFVGFVKQSN